MKCHYCGKEVWLVRHLLDGDFCSPVHRKKYHERLRRSLEQLPQVTGPPAPVAGFHFNMPPAESQGTAGRRTLGFQSKHFGLMPPKYSLELSAIFGQSFFGPTAASAVAPPAAAHRSLPGLDPMLPPPDTTPLGRSLDLASGMGIDAGRAPLPLGELRIHEGSPAVPIGLPPAALSAGAPKMEWPRLDLSAVTGDSWSSGSAAGAAMARVTDLRHVPLASWTRSNLEPLMEAGRLAGKAQELPRQAAAIATRNGSCLRLTRCAPPAFAAPLLAADAIAIGNIAARNAAVNPVARTASMCMPAVVAGTSVALAAHTDGIWKLNAATPWNLSQGTQAEPILGSAAEAILPRLALSPVRPGLAAESDVRRVDARPLPMVASVARPDDNTIGTPERPAVPPVIAASAAVPVLPGSFAPHLYASDLVRPQEVTMQAAAGQGVPLAGRLAASDPLTDPSLASCVETSSASTASRRPHVGQPLKAVMSALAPQTASPRFAGEFLASGPSTATAIPAGTALGFGRKSFAAVGPKPVEKSLEPVVPAPAAIETARMSMPRPQLAISTTGVTQRPGVVPLDVYVQRVKSVPNRDCEWQPTPRRLTQPTGLPGIWPSRFEQLVLQDWRRRYPARQISLTPAPVTGGARILPMTRHLTALARMRQNAPHFVKGLAAAAFVGAILWFSASTQTVRTNVAADKHWFRDAIARRATLVHDDNFHSGLNLWEGRKNWAQSWSYSPDGFMRTGQLALYRPTLKMDNYKLEFFAQIENKSVGWVFRAKDEQNYYAMKLSVTEPGPRPLVSVVRYPVLNGKKGKRVQIPLPIMMHNNTPYHVALDVKGTRFRAFVEDQEVDSWNDDKLAAGGVGFFSEAGERSRLYWVKVSKNTDWLGRLCGMIAGGSSQDSADLWNPQPSGSLALLDRGSILDGAKNADRRRGVTTLPTVTAL